MELLERLQIQQQILLESFQKRFTSDYALPDFPKVLEDWHNMTYPEFRAETDLIFAKRLLSTCNLRDWEEYFYIAKSKSDKIKADIQAIQIQNQ